ncbi:quinone oxidoreductase family protein [Nesterenkonia lacusekhoensis]|uniref:NADPH2:quinone reductase n=1 Tax=Nesterenkonia lacusekhoensis TaxID=150832 RepID=A0ABS4T022_9MICC|nr:quinone oxidoreductase [Nesterenkonia lacusekhoensis]MBP2317758.1 NADPH2:quinone reductase [Nesterenkonia lacusekhoensis]
MSEQTVFPEDLPDSALVMRAEEAGGTDVFQAADVSLPSPGEGQILVKTAAAGVNFIETYQRSGVYPVDYPFTPGTEGAGTVISLGEGVEGFTVGERVATTEAATGTYSTHFVVDAAKAVHVPDEVTDEQAAALPLQGVTAHYLINSTYRVSAGETVLTHAGAGGVGQILTQLLKAKGARVITTTSTEEKAKIAQAAGADYVLGYDNFAEQVLEITKGEGVSVVYDGVGKDTYQGSLESLAVRGMLVAFGGASGQVPPIDPQELNRRGGLFVTRPAVHWYLRNAQERAWRFSELFSALTAGELELNIGGTYPLTEVARAHEDLEGRRTTGKLLLVP